MINASSINAAAINSAGGSSSTGGAEGEAVLLFNQAVIADTGLVSLSFNQIVQSVGDSALLFDQAVANPTGSATLDFVQSVADVGSASISFSQNVYTPAVVASDWINWDVQVTANSVDISTDLLNQISIQAEQSAARTAEFTLLLSGVVDAVSWVGREIVINYVQNSGAVWRRFNGKVLTADYDLKTKTLVCTCSDELQAVIDGYSNEQLQTLTGGYYSPHVFSADNIGWDHLDDLLTTVSQAVQLDSNQTLQVLSLDSKATADYSFDENLILDDSLDVRLASKHQLVNKVSIEFDARFSRLFYSTRQFFWNYSRSFCENYWEPVTFPNQQMISSAFDSGGWHVNSISHTPIYPSGIYTCDGKAVGYQNAYPDGIIGFNASASFRWTQSLTENYAITVRCDDSINTFGEIEQRVNASASIDTTAENWGSADDDYSTIPSGFVQTGELGYFAKDDVNSADIEGALSVLIEQAKTTLNQSHQQNSVFFQLPLSPYIELNQTIAVNDSDLQAKGVIKSFSERYDFDRGEPITDIELAISSGRSSQPSVNQTLSIPAKPVIVENTQAVGSAIEIVDYVGNLADSPAENPDWEGIILNSTGAIAEFERIFPKTDVYNEYSQTIKLPFPAIDADSVDNKAIEISQTINLQIADDPLTITA